MAKPFYVRYESPEGMSEEALRILEQVSITSDKGTIRKGTNEATKAIERSEALLVYIALDTDPPEVVGHLPLLCEEKKIPYVYVPTKKDLGKSTGLKVSMAAAAITDYGSQKKRIQSLETRIRELAGI